jgi:hypothetical protein
MRFILANVAVVWLWLSASAAFAAPNTFTASTNQHYWLNNGTPFVTIGYNRYDVWN